MPLSCEFNNAVGSFPQPGSEVSESGGEHGPDAVVPGRFGEERKNNFRATRASVVAPILMVSRLSLSKLSVVGLVHWIEERSRGIAAPEFTRIRILLGPVA